MVPRDYKTEAPSWRCNGGVKTANQSLNFNAFLSGSARSAHAKPFVEAALGRTILENEAAMFGGQIRGLDCGCTVFRVEGLLSLDQVRERMKASLSSKFKDLYGIDIEVSITDITEEGRQFNFQKPLTGDELKLLDEILANCAHLRPKRVPVELLRCYWIIAPLVIAHLLLAFGKNLSHCPGGALSLVDEAEPSDTRDVLAVYAIVIPCLPKAAIAWMNKFLSMVFEGCKYDEEGQLNTPSELYDLSALERHSERTDRRVRCK